MSESTRSRAPKRLIALCVTAVAILWAAVLVADAAGDNKRSVAKPLGVFNGAFPAWSPDGRKLAFAGSRDGNDDDIYVMSADGSNLRRLTQEPAIDSYPSWSADGHRVVFESNRTGHSAIYVMKADGSDQRRLTRSLGLASFESFSPAWSPNGEQIAFVRGRCCGHNYAGIYVMNADGSKQRALTRNSAHDDDPAWSRNGKEIVFERAPSNLKSSQIYVISANGTTAHRLTSRGFNYSPNWSPDGRTIAFASFPRACLSLSYVCLRTGGLYVMNADGSNRHRLRPGGQGGVYPRWSPDGRKIAFQGVQKDGSEQIYVMKADGSDQHALTHK
jgi:Tol biopolymer transport system component